jgi:hypothetical protein
LCFLLASRADDKGGGKEKKTKIQSPRHFPRRCRAALCDRIPRDRAKFCGVRAALRTPEAGGCDANIKGYRVQVS